MVLKETRLGDIADIVWDNENGSLEGNDFVWGLDDISRREFSPSAEIG